MSSTTKDKRIRRIERRGSPELVQAMRKGQISIRLADSLFYMPAEEQRRELECRLKAVEERQRRSRLVAATIRTYLGTAKRIDLGELQGRIREALASSA